MLLDYIPQTCLIFLGFWSALLDVTVASLLAVAMASLLVVAVDSFSVVASFLRIPLKY